MTETVAIVVPVWNRAELLRRMLETVSLQTRAPDAVFMVDNGSTDDAPEVARRWGATVISMGRNAGFAAAVNRGIAASRTDWIAVLNSDVELRPDWIEKLLAAALESRAWFAGGKILMASSPSRIDGTWDLAARSGCAWRAGHGWPDSAAFSKRRAISLASGTATLYRRELFERVGLFEEAYESYLEDVDLALRCAALGLPGVYEPTAVCLHWGAASAGAWSDRVVYLISRNQALLVRRTFPLELKKKWRWKIAAGQLLWGLVALRHGRARAWLRGKRAARHSPIAAVALDAAVLETALTCMEREIRALQIEHDRIVHDANLYWRLYFAVTGSESTVREGESE